MSCLKNKGTHPKKVSGHPVDKHGAKSAQARYCCLGHTCKRVNPLVLGLADMQDARRTIAANVNTRSHIDKYILYHRTEGGFSQVTKHQRYTLRGLHLNLLFPHKKQCIGVIGKSVPHPPAQKKLPRQGIPPPHVSMTLEGVYIFIPCPKPNNNQ